MAVGLKEMVIIGEVVGSGVGEKVKMGWCVTVVLRGIVSFGS